MLGITAMLIIPVVLVVTGILIFAAIVHDIRQGQSFRERLSVRLAGLRLRQVLPRLGIDPHRYLYTHFVVDIEKQLRACESCEYLAQCDACLGKCSPEEMQFCPAINRSLIPSE